MVTLIALFFLYASSLVCYSLSVLGRFIRFYISLLPIESKLKSMSKSIDDPVLISVPSDLKSEGVIRGAIASSSFPYCSKLHFLYFRIAYRACSYENFPHSESR